MAIQQLNVSKPVAGTDYVGNLPGDLHQYVVFAVAIMAFRWHSHFRSNRHA